VHKSKNQKIYHQKTNYWHRIFTRK